MQKDERDVLEVLIFDEIEETVGSWLRAIMQRLEKEQMAIRRDQQKQPASRHKTMRGTPVSICVQALPTSQWRAVNRLPEAFCSNVLDWGEKPHNGKTN